MVHTTCYTHFIFLTAPFYVTLQRTDKNKSALRSLHARMLENPTFGAEYSLWSLGEFAERSPKCICTWNA